MAMWQTIIWTNEYRRIHASLSLNELTGFVYISSSFLAHVIYAPTAFKVLHGNIGLHDDVIKWKHFPRYWPFVRGIHRSPVNSPHKGQWRGALMFSLIYTRISGWVNNSDAGDLRRYRAHYGVTVMDCPHPIDISMKGLDKIDLNDTISVTSHEH